jgi:carnosine N-methyltransferase
MAATESTKMRMAFGRLDAESAAVGEAIGYPGKLDRMDEAEAVNAAVCKAIGDMAVKENKMDADAVGANKQGSLFRVREAMWHYVRDWTEEGRAERAVIFKPVLDLLQSLDKPEERGEKTVLIPGSGLGRLAWDISELGTSSAMKAGHRLMNQDTAQLPANILNT